MSSTTVSQNPTSHMVASIIPKLQDADADIRYMVLNDLNQMFINGHATFLHHDYSTCGKVVDGLIHTLTDNHGDVQNLAIKCLGPFITKVPEQILAPTIERISNIKTDNSVDISIPALAIRAIVVALPQPIPGIPRSQKVIDSYSAISRALIPRLIGRIVVTGSVKPTAPPPKSMLQEDLEKAHDSNSLDLVVEVAKCFGSMLQEAEVQALEQITMQVLESDRSSSVMKKKAVAAISALSVFFCDSLLASHVSYTIQRLREPHLSSQQRKLYISVYGSLARSIPQKFGPYLATLAPFVLAPLSQQELDEQREAEIEADGERDVQLEEVREAAFVSIESFLESCAQNMKPHIKQVLEASVQFLKYEPNVADDEDDDMEVDEPDDDTFELDEDFEEETGFEDEDDVSWKVRRCSAKVLRALIRNLDINDPVMYGQIAPALISRFKEPEESVRNEIISALAFLILSTGSISSAKPTATGPPMSQSRKRRRGYSDSFGNDYLMQQSIMNGYASPTTPPPADVATDGLTKINPDIVKAAAKLLKSSTPASKRCVISLLKDMVLSQQGGLSEHAGLVIDPVVETMHASTGSVSNAASNALQVESLALLRAIAENHSSKVLEPYLSKLVPVLIKAANDRYAKVASEAFITVEVFLKALTPPRSAASKSQNREYLTSLYRTIVESVSAHNTDTEVRQNAVKALGLLIGRTSGSAGSSLLSQQDRFTGQDLLAERLHNEVTRLACVRAIDTIAVLAQSQKDFKPEFVGAVSLELGAQLRKSNRSLRGASLSALRTLTVNRASRVLIADDVVDKLVDMLVPLFDTEDLHMIGPALVVLAAFVEDKPKIATSSAVVGGICNVAQSSLAAPAIDTIVTCVSAIGQSGSGKNLMNGLLQIAPKSDTDIIGQLIGALLVSGADSLDVKFDSFVRELQTQKDVPKRCLALSVLGEATLRMGVDSPLTPDFFIPYFSDESERVQLSAAIALGRAGAGNVKVYLPKILDAMSQGKQYFLLHSVKELLQHNNSEDDIRPYTKALWDNITNTSQAEDNKVVGAECIGRLAIIDPTAYLPQLQAYLQNPSSTVRGMVISALRFVFADSTATYDANLRAIIVPMLATMLVDSDLDNQRLSLSTFNSALHNKPDIVLPHLAELLPQAMQATVIRPELVREIAMGPFKHKVDDGLEIRKAAYETLYALLETPGTQQRLNIPSLYDRIVEGLSDEHEIKILCCLVLGKLLIIAPAESSRRLDALTTKFRATLSFKPKDTAVKQELEKVAEENKAVIKVSLLVNKAFANESGIESRSFKEYMETAKREHPNLIKAVEDEVRGTGER